MYQLWKQLLQRKGKNYFNTHQNMKESHQIERQQLKHTEQRALLVDLTLGSSMVKGEMDI